MQHDATSQLSDAHADTRSPPFFPKHDNIYFLNGQKERLQAMLLWPTLWAPEKRNAGIVYTNGLNGCVTARQNSQPECSVI